MFLSHYFCSSAVTVDLSASKDTIRLMYYPSVLVIFEKSWICQMRSLSFELMKVGGYSRTALPSACHYPMLFPRHALLTIMRKEYQARLTFKLTSYGHFYNMLWLLFVVVVFCFSENRFSYFK